MIWDVSVHHRSISTHTHTYSNLMRLTAWTVVGSVALWRLRSLLFRFSTQGGRLTSVLILFLTMFHWNRRRKDRRKEQERTSYSFGITIFPGAITVGCSSAKRENFNHISFSFTQLSLISLTCSYRSLILTRKSLENQRSNAHSNDYENLTRASRSNTGYASNANKRKRGIWRPCRFRF